jgi:2-octaprenyl-6-methoxyphenol hydroxylase
MNDTKITIIGGGPLGSALACALAHFKIPCRIIEKTPRDVFLKDKTSDCRAIALSPTSKNLLNHIGIWEQVEKDSCPIQRVETVHGSTDTKVTFDGKEEHPLGHIVAMSLLRQGIVQQTTNHPDMIEWVEGSLDSFDRNDLSLKIHLQDGRSFHTPLLIGADGKGSFVRDLGGFKTINHPYGKEAIVCTYEHTNDHENIAWEIFMDEGPLAILPMTQNRSSLVWSVHEDIAQSLREASDTLFDEIVIDKLAPYLKNPKRISKWWIYPLSLQFTTRLEKEGVLLAGDAAHVIHPLAGQGINMGFKDAAALVDVLKDCLQVGLPVSDRAAHKKYERWRRLDNFSMIFATDGLERLFSSDLKIIKKMRDIGLKMVDRNRGLKQLLSENAMGTLGNLPGLLREKSLF